MTTKNEPELTEEMFVGHRVHIHFLKPAETDGVPFKVSKVEAELRSYKRGDSFTLRDITAAFDEAGNEISKEAGLFGKGMKGHPYNIIAMTSPKPVI